jgi:magnesium chelatase family protein
LGESSAVVAARVSQARQAQRERLTGTRWRCNAEVPGPDLALGVMRLDRSVSADLDRAVEWGTLTARGFHRVLRVTWTLA